MCNRSFVRPHAFQTRRPPAFTLIEVLVVVALIALLVAVLVPVSEPGSLACQDRGLQGQPA